MLLKHKIAKTRAKLGQDSMWSLLRFYSSSLVSLVKFIGQVTVNAVDYTQYDSDVLK